MDDERILRYIEPIYRFCLKRQHRREDAEDLAQEILIHVIHGLHKYQIENLDAWVWRIAHNRYARSIHSQTQSPEVLCLQEGQDDYALVESLLIKEEHQNAFSALHSLSKTYRELMVDYYVHGLPVQELAQKHRLPVTTVKWRLHVGRERIKERMETMTKIYDRIHWRTKTCNGNLDTNQYLYSQIARAICKAAYRRPMSVEEISMDTGLPAMFIEDEIPRLLYGEALTKQGSKYLTNFIILGLEDNQRLQEEFTPYVDELLGLLTPALREKSEEIQRIGFYGSDRGVARLGYIILPLIIRRAVRVIQDTSEELKVGPYPPRKDGGYGWFVVSEAADPQERPDPSSSGLNSYSDGSMGQFGYYWTGWYMNDSTLNHQLAFLSSKQIIPQIALGSIPTDCLTADEIADLMAVNLVERHLDSYRLTVPLFSSGQLSDLITLFTPQIQQMQHLLNELVRRLWHGFHAFVPKHLDDQINQYLAGYVHNIIGLVLQEMVEKGLLAPPPTDGPLSYSVFYVNPRPDRPI